MMRLRRRLAAAGLSLVLAACMRPGSGGSAPDRVLVVLFDVSRSTWDGSIRERYLDAFRTVIASVEDGGVVAADIIDANPLAHSTLPVNESFEPYDPLTDNPLTHEERAREQIEEAVRGAEEILRQPPGRGGTSILDALVLAERVFASYPEAEERLLVLFSDMVEVSDRYRFSRRNLSTPAVDGFLGYEREGGHLPDLRSAEVYVVGAGAVASDRLRPERIQAIERFWLRYFAACGAHLPPARYGAAIVTFP